MGAIEEEDGGEVDGNDEDDEDGNVGSIVVTSSDVAFCLSFSICFLFSLGSVDTLAAKWQGVGENDSERANEGTKHPFNKHKRYS